MKPIVRFAPSPTGFLHIGSARTALFNWLYAKRHGGTFLLRIEDTDRERSTEASVQTILDGMTWLGLDWQGEAVSQYARRERHAEVAREMVAAGKAYFCYATPDELTAMRAAQAASGQPQRYDGRWRDRDPAEAPAGVKPAIRLKAPVTGETVVTDAVKGTITVQNTQLDDMVLLRSDGVPTYMHAVVVDDHDMGITHVIRGDDHMTNTFRQVQIYHAMGWDVPIFAHLPMILGPDGAKLSKRHGAPAVSDYRDRGYLPEALRNYLLRLCWSHGDDEIITDAQAAEWFDFEHIGASPARFDFTKLDSVNAHYLRLKPDNDLVDLVLPLLKKVLEEKYSSASLEIADFRSLVYLGLTKDILMRAMPELKPRAKNIVELAHAAAFYVMPRPLPLDDSAKKILTPDAKALLMALQPQIAALTPFTGAALEELCRSVATAQNLKLGALAQPLRAALTGSATSPPIFGAADILGKEEALGRIADALR
ncbi:MAG: glutamate--tRNA ligase [Alphaproteobacteria bacterium]|nr:glutamate--tRNA ligase [Alphaproteobacteria bacterium]